MKDEKRLIKLFEKYTDVQLAYLFGSSATGKVNPLSDIDIAVQIRDSISVKDKLELQLHLLSELTSIFNTDKIDLIIMNDVSISLNYEIIKYNYPVYIKNKEDKVDFEHKILSMYLDRRYYEKRAANEFLNKVNTKGLSF